MSYFFRQQQMRRRAEPVEKSMSAAMDRAADFRALAHHLWDEARVTRGKTTPESNSGSFAPRNVGMPRTSGGRKWNAEAEAALYEVQQVGYRRLASGKPYTESSFEQDMQDEMRDSMGAGYEREVSTMAHRIWNEFRRNGPHTYYEPLDWLRSVRL